MDGALQLPRFPLGRRLLFMLVLVSVISAPLSGPALAATAVETSGVQPGDRVTVTYEWSSGETESTPSAVTTDSPDWTVADSEVIVINETTGQERRVAWQHSQGQPDTWLLEESIGPNETLRVTVTYAVPSDAAGGQYGFEARADIGGEWHTATDVVSVEGSGDDSNDGDESTDDGQPEVTVTYSWSSGVSTSTPSVVTTDSPDWSVEGSAVTVVNNSTDEERRVSYQHSQGQPDTWLLEESIGPNETLRISVTYAVPSDVVGGQYGFEARAEIGGEWRSSTDVVNVEGSNETNDGTNESDGSSTRAMDVTYTWSTGNNTSSPPSITTIESPDWQIGDSAVMILNERTGEERAVPYHHSLGRPDTWILEEPFGPNETLQITVTYEVPDDAAGGQYVFEASGSIAGQWELANDALTIEGSGDGSDGTDETTETLPDQVTVSYTWANNGDTSALPSAVTTDSPDWTIQSSTVSAVNESTGEEREVPYHHSLGSPDSWILEEPLGPDETLRITVTYQVPGDASPGEYGFEARAEIHDEWVVAGDSVSLTATDSPIEIDIENATAVVNSTATAILTIQATNTGPEPLSSFGINLQPLHSDLTLLSQSSSGGRWIENRRAWLWLSGLGANETVTARLTVQIPEDTSKQQYQVSAVASDDSSSVTDTGTIELTNASSEDDHSVVGAIDDGDRRIGFNEVLRGIELFNSGEPVPNTGGKSVGFGDVLELIELFNSGQEIPN